MSIDCRTRRHRDRRPFDRDAIFDSLIPEALSRNAELAARGLRYKNLPALTLSVGDRTVTLCERRGALRIEAGCTHPTVRPQNLIAMLSRILSKTGRQQWDWR